MPHQTPPTTSGASISAFLYRVLAHLPAIAIVGTAFLYFAGYTYVDEYRRGFGITFGATEMSTAEVVGTGYTVVLAVIILNFWSIVWQATWPIPIAALLVGGLLLGKKLGWLSFARAIAKLEAAATRTRTLPAYILSVCAAILILIGAGPAGHYAAAIERKAVAQKVRDGCCFSYANKGAAPVVGFLIAQSHDRLYIATPGGLVAMAPGELTIVKAPAVKRIGR